MSSVDSLLAASGLLIYLVASVSGGISPRYIASILFARSRLMVSDNLGSSRPAFEYVRMLLEMKLDELC